MWPKPCSTGVWVRVSCYEKYSYLRNIYAGQAHKNLKIAACAVSQAATGSGVPKWGRQLCCQAHTAVAGMGWAMA